MIQLQDIFAANIYIFPVKGHCIDVGMRPSGSNGIDFIFDGSPGKCMGQLV